ncbi:MAG TPA: alpha/beta fold hydrolase [Gaiellaceae bacterium]|nr:alpha/beta fold hydrolase [Gaiellaceae bacterium]
MADRVVEAGGVELCMEPFGDPSEPAILLVQGLGASMAWWEEGFCRVLAGAGRFVIRYDHRDTGRSVTYEPGRPGYTTGTLVRDAVGVIDAYGVEAVHLVGVSAGAGMAQVVALEHPDRVRSLVLISSSPAVPTGRELPPPTEAFSRFFSTASVDWDDPTSVVEYVVAYARMLAGGERPFDEPAMRELVRREVERARAFAARRNHELLADDDNSHLRLASISSPTLVIHGSADPMFPVEHGQALAEEIPGATLLTLEGAGHGIERADWETIAAAIIEHTGAADQPEVNPATPV